MTQVHEAHVTHIAALIKEVRHAKRMADKFDKRWNDLNTAFKAKHAEEDRIRQQRRRPPKEEALKREDQGENYAMGDAFGAQAWWQGKAEATATILLAEVAAYEVIMGSRS